MIKFDLNDKLYFSFFFHFRKPKIAMKWVAKQRRVRGRPKENWMEGIKKAMHERNLNDGQWEGRKQWSLGVGQGRKTF